MDRKFKKGDRVKVWSLQSFSGGGFLKGEPAFVKQDQYGDFKTSVLPIFGVEAVPEGGPEMDP